MGWRGSRGWKNSLNLDLRSAFPTVSPPWLESGSPSHPPWELLHRKIPSTAPQWRRWSVFWYMLDKHLLVIFFQKLEIFSLLHAASFQQFMYQYCWLTLVHLRGWAWPRFRVRLRSVVKDPTLDITELFHKPKYWVFLLLISQTCANCRIFFCLLFCPIWGLVQGQALLPPFVLLFGWNFWCSRKVQKHQEWEFYIKSNCFSPSSQDASAGLSLAFLPRGNPMLSSSYSLHSGSLLASYIPKVSSLLNTHFRKGGKMCAEAQTAVLHQNIPVWLCCSHLLQLLPAPSFSKPAGWLQTVSLYPSHV